MLFRQKPDVQINQFSPVELSQKKKLVVGCGRTSIYNDFAAPRHEETHTAKQWTTLDINPSTQPDIVANAALPDLKNRLQLAKAIPPQGYDIIYSEGIAVNVFSDPCFVKNMHDLLTADGILVVDNACYDDINNFQEMFGYIYAWFGEVVFSKKLFKLGEITAKLINAELKNCYFDTLIANLTKAKFLSERLHIEEPILQQLLPAQQYIKQYLDIDGKQDVDTLVKLNNQALDLQTVIKENPELRAILQEKPFFADYLKQQPMMLKIIWKQLNSDKKNQTLDELRKLTPDEISDCVQFFKNHSGQESAMMNLSVIPRAFDVGDADDVDAFLSWQQSGYACPSDSNDSQPKTFYNKEKVDHVMKSLMEKFTKLFQSENIGDLKDISDFMHLMLDEKFLFDPGIQFSDSIDHAIIEWAYNMDAHYAFRSCLAIVKYIQHSLAAQPELINQNIYGMR